MLPVQKAQFIAQCRSYFEIHEQLKKQMEQLELNYNSQLTEFDFNHWVHECCQYQYELITQSTFAQGLSNAVSVFHPNSENQSSQVCLAKLNTNLEPYDAVDMDTLVSNSNVTKLKLEDFEEALTATLEEANASSYFYKTDGDDSDELVVDTDYESDSNDKA